jgi:hypothetical protein
MGKSEIVPFMQSLIDTKSPKNKEFLDELLLRLSAPSIMQSNEFTVIFLL